MSGRRLRTGGHGSQAPSEPSVTGGVMVSRVLRRGNGSASEVPWCGPSRSLRSLHCPETTPRTGSNPWCTVWERSPPCLRLGSCAPALLVPSAVPPPCLRRALCCSLAAVRAAPPTRTHPRAVEQERRPTPRKMRPGALRARQARAEPRGRQAPRARAGQADRSRTPAPTPMRLSMRPPMARRKTLTPRSFAAPTLTAWAIRMVRSAMEQAVSASRASLAIPPSAPQASTATRRPSSASRVATRMRTAQAPVPMQQP